MSEIDAVYRERNELVSALSKIFPAYLARHENGEWEDDWRNIVFIVIPTESIYQKYIQGGFKAVLKKQVSWHIHDSELPLFRHLEYRTNEWDGHDTDEKYRRLEGLKINGLAKKFL